MTGGGHPGRAGLRMRDMLGAVVILVVIIGAVMAFYGGCSFSPGRPSVDPSSVPSADASGELTRVARSVEFPVREPAVPRGWRANSTSTGPVGAAQIVVRVGWVTAEGAFLQLSQSGAEPADVVVKETDAGQTPAPTGTVEVDGMSWTTYPGRRDEPAWVAELDGTVALITGSASEAEFRQLAEATQKAEPLAK